MSTADFRPPGAFLSHLVEYCGLRKRRSPEIHGNLEVHHLDLTDLRVASSMFTPFIVPKSLSGHENVGPEQLELEADNILEVATSMRQEWSVCLIGGTVSPSSRAVIARLREFNVATLDRVCTENVYSAQSRESKLTTLGTALANSLGRHLLSVYRDELPASGSRFFGRRREVAALEASGNYAIIGNRRIGKTSLMQEVERRLKLKHRNLVSITEYASTNMSADDLVERIRISLAGRTTDRRTLKDVVDSKAEEVGVAVFIDEFDRFLVSDCKNNYAATDMLRQAFYKTPEASSNSIKRLFVAGFRRLNDAHDRQDTPLYNLTTPRVLSRFSLDETREMVEVPMRRLGIPIGDSDICEQIYKESGGHPELIRMCCDAVVSFYDEQNCVPSSTQILSAVFDSDRFRQKVWATFLANTNSFEQLACYLLIQNAISCGNAIENMEFNISEIDRLYRRVALRRTPVEINSVLANLKSSSVITTVSPGSTKYQFCVPQLSRFISGLDLEYCIKTQARECNSVVDGSILAEPGERLS